MFFNVNGEEKVIDCRPSDAIAVGLRMNVPIYAEACVLENIKYLDWTGSLIMRLKNRRINILYLYTIIKNLLKWKGLLLKF